MRGIAIAGLLFASNAWGHGPSPLGTDIYWQPGNLQEIAVGLNWGLMRSHDGGQTWDWMCEDALDTLGQFYPRYALTASNSLFETSLDGLRVFRDECSLRPLTVAVDKTDFASDTTLGPDGALYVASATGIHKSMDDGVTFPINTVPTAIGDWWGTIRVAPSDAQRVYITGYRINPDLTKTFQAYKSIDGGQSWSAMSIAGMTFSKDSGLEVAGISPTDADVVYARITIENTDILGDALYRTTNGGTSWTKILAKQDSLAAFVARANGDIVAGTPTLGAVVSHDQGDHWIDLAMPPHLVCLEENSAHEVWGCTYNFSVPTVPMADGYALMKTTDLSTWTPVMKIQNLDAPIPCEPGTIQNDKCAGMQWCGIVDLFGITSTVIDCNAGATDTTPIVKDHGGCGCASRDRDATFVLAIAVLAMLRRRRR
jgi:uncharacterized protein (TIGR03382 family)